MYIMIIFIIIMMNVIMIIITFKCYNRGMEVKLPTNLENRQTEQTKRPTDQPTDGQAGS